MAEAIVSIVLEQLTSEIYKKLREEVRLVKGVRNEINKLTSNFRAIQNVHHDAEQKQVKERPVRGDEMLLGECDASTAKTFLESEAAVIDINQPEPVAAGIRFLYDNSGLIKKCC
ncbi:hypothetical protein Dsin_013868 [Dipteronia sinensis]|uniref:Disease resistance N-terminal domain-containing protein n=1 Tax=Dipteronia sinensis TaxID=43782 RepID=A0AAE0AKS6_9ROSI|nr:hypothetical protein Dsin_013868 [Dipteronia sinensis]